MSKFFDWLDQKMRGAGNSLKESQPAQPETPSEAGVQDAAPVEQQVPDTTKPDNSETKSQPDEKSKPQLESKDNLLRSVVATLGRVIEDKESSEGMKLVIWLETDALRFKNYANEQYCHRFITALVNEHGYSFEEVSFSLGTPEEELHATRIGDNELEHLQVVENIVKPTTTSCKAIITIFGGAGSLLQEKYTLSSDHMKERMISAYNIGAGQFPKVPTGYRENHIAIDDNPQSPMIEKNKYVSRMHAHIGYSDTFGFYLQVEKDGTRLLGKRTRIFRGEERIECDNPQAKIPLQDGDLIELGKAVVLKYVQIKDK